MRTQYHSGGSAQALGMHTRVPDMLLAAAATRKAALAAHSCSHSAIPVCYPTRQCQRPTSCACPCCGRPCPCGCTCRGWAACPAWVACCSADSACCAVDCTVVHCIGRAEGIGGSDCTHCGDRVPATTTAAAEAAQQERNSNFVRNIQFVLTQPTRLLNFAAQGEVTAGTCIQL